MSGIPSVFNRTDFISILLPGYVAVLAYVVVFQTETFFTQNQVVSSIIYALIFLVAGPAVGLTLLQFHRGLLASYL